MEETTLLSQSDADEIGAALKVAPHARSSQFEVVTKNVDGEPLVSLDELYEKTGQESIGVFVKGFKLLVEKNKLSRIHAEVLNIKGVESWSILPDQLNASRGGEGFFTAIKDGIVSFVKAIISFIAGIWNWIREKFARIFGFEKTTREMEFLKENTDNINAKMTAFVSDMGGNKKEFDVADFYESLPKNFTDRESLAIIKSRLDSTSGTIKRLETSMPALAEAMQAIDKIGRNGTKAFDTYTRELNDLKSKFSRKTVTAADVTKFMYVLENEFFVTLNYQEMYEVMELLNKEFFDVELKGLGFDKSIQEVRDTLKRDIETIRVQLTPAEVAGTSAIVRNMGTILIPLRNVSLSEATLKKFSSMLTVKDAQLMNEISVYLNKLDGTTDLPGRYVAFCKKVSEYLSMTEMLLGSINNIYKTYNNIVKWHSRVTTMVSTTMTGDVKRILEAMEKNLSKEEMERNLTDGSPTLPYSMDKTFSDKYPGLNIPEDTSRLMRSLQEVEQVSKPLNRFINTLKG